MENQFKNLPKKVFHGTTSNHLPSLMQKIDVNIKIANEKPDFGKGFYTTTNFNQAMIQAERKTSKHNRSQKRQEKYKANFKPEEVKPIVLEYDVNIEYLKNLPPTDKSFQKTHLLFEEPNELWGNFVYNNRSDETVKQGLHNIDQRYHYVYGPLADGYIMSLIEEFETKKITWKEFMQKITPRKENGRYQDQLSLHTLIAAQSLTLRGVK